MSDEQTVDVVQRLLKERFEPFFQDAILSVVDVDRLYGAGAACNLMTNLLMHATVAQWKNQMVFMGHLKPAEEDAFQEEAAKRITEVFVELLKNYGRFGDSQIIRKGIDDDHG